MEWMEAPMRLPLLFALVTCFAPHAALAEPESAVSLIRHIETQHLGKTSYARAVMTVRTEHWAREMGMEMWGEGREKFLVRVLKPKKEKGVSTLKINDDLWNFLPKIDRLIKVPSSLMGDSWMGSHFTNDDMVKEYKIDELFELSFKERGAERAVVVGIPREDAAVVWGRIEYDVDMVKRIPVKVRYYDEDGELIRTFIFDQVKEISGRWIALRMRIQPEEDPEEMTEFVYEHLEFDLKFEKELFSLRSLRRKR